MAGKVRNLSTLVERQLPEFISNDYPKFVKFLQKYYEQLEINGQSLDIIQNFSKYQDIDTYEKSLLSEKTKLTSAVGETDTIIYVESTESFPEKNGYVLINNEAIFYQEKTENSFVNCYRNVSATTKLGDLYNKSVFNSVDYENVGDGVEHNNYSDVLNISNLFLYAFVKSFESQYLSAFPKNNLKDNVDKKTLIKNIKQFYRSKGTEQSIKFIFNSIVAEDVDDVPSVYYPKDYTFKSSNGEWINKYSLKVRSLSPGIHNLVGQRIIQDVDRDDSSVQYSFAVVDNIIDIGDNFYELVLAPETIVGNFVVGSKTFLTKSLNASAGRDNKVNVYSTSGWKSSSGTFLIGNEVISYKSKNVNQFTIDTRSGTTATYPTNTEVYDNSTVFGTYVDESGTEQIVKILVLGILYDFNVSEKYPYSSENDVVQVSSTGFETKNTIIFDKINQRVRWLINESNTAPSSPNSTITSDLQEALANVSAIFEDDQYYYITSSGFPSHVFGEVDWNQRLQDQNHLKIIRKTPSLTTEIYSTLPGEVGVLVNGVTVRSHKDEEEVVFGEIQSITVQSQGRAYQNPPYVLIQNGVGEIVASAKAVLSGEVVERIEVIDSGESFFPPVPSVTITSGRNAVVNAVVTGDRITSLVIVNPGEYYSTPPLIIIRDAAGKGRFANFKSIISNDGKLVGFEKVDEGKFYTQQNVSVEVVSIGSGATATANVRKWRKDRYKKYQQLLDPSNGYFFLNNDVSLGYGYSYIANPKKLRSQLNDNIDDNGIVPPQLTHSPVLGYAFDGNPIYGPYGYSDPLDSSSNISRITSSYRLKTSRVGGPSTTEYSLGTFVQDYFYNHRFGSLDQNNGRFCITPEYPNGVYAYFITIDQDNNPVYPYFIGENYYSIPVDSNYNKQISQKDLPVSISRLRTDLTPNNGDKTFSFVRSIETGSVNSVDVEYSHNIFSPGSVVYFDYSGTNGEGVISEVSSVTGEEITSILSTVQPLSLDTNSLKCLKIESVSPCYLFDGDMVTQNVTGATGTVVGNVINSNSLVLKDVTQNFSDENSITSETKVLSFILNQSSSYTLNSDIFLTNGKQSIILRVENNRLIVSSNVFAIGEPVVFSNSFSGIIENEVYYVSEIFPTGFRVSSQINGASITLSNNSSPSAVAFNEKGKGIVLENSTNRNTLRIKVTSGSFEIDSSYFIRSSNLNDTKGSKIVQINDLSSNIEILSSNSNIAIVETASPHRITNGDKVSVDLNPDDSETETTVYVRKRIYQKVTFNNPSYSKIIRDTGVGRLVTLNSGSDYSNGGNNTYTDVELIFADQNQCRDDQGRVVGASSPLAVIGKPGNSNNARATVSVTNGLVTSITITNKGSGYKKGDLLTVSAASLERTPSSTSTRFFRTEVDHVGFSTTDTTLFLNNVSSISNNDLLQISSEIVKVQSINVNNSSVVVLRGQNNTEIIDHYNDVQMLSFGENYNFTENFRIGFGQTNGIIISYDNSTQEAIVVYDLDRTLENIDPLTPGKVFFDSSTPRKLVSVKDVLESPSYKFEFSFDNSEWIRNPIIPIQKFYRYKFDTSNYTLSGSFLEFSPSGNFNILTNEILRSDSLPGSENSFTILKFGYGPFTPDNTFDEKKQINYINYFYYDKNSIIDSDKSYLRLIDDPIQGEKTVVYTTLSSFVYELNYLPQTPVEFLNSSYTTTSIYAKGRIDKINVSNQGEDFTSLPIVSGISPSKENECLAEVIWSSSTQIIESVVVKNPGIGYSKPKAILINETGRFAQFDVIKNDNGSVAGIIVTNNGRGYTTKPEIKIVESDVKCFASSDNIGTPKTIRTIFNGKDFSNDSTLEKSYTTPTILVLKNISTSGFVSGEKIVQYDGNNIIAEGTVSGNGWKDGSNVLKVENIEGEFVVGLQIRGNLRNSTALVVKIFTTILSPNIKSYYDNLGSYKSDYSVLGSLNQRLADSYFYQDYSYVIKSKTPINAWRNLVKQTIHPSGFKVFGEVTVESSGSTTLPVPSENQTSTISFIQLWDQSKNIITVENTYKTITQSTANVSNIRSIRGKGSVFNDQFDTGETQSLEFYLQPEFNGYFDENGNIAGNRVFTIRLRGSNAAYSVSNSNNVFLSLDGIVQEPGKAFTISGTQLTFARAPLGYRDVFGDPVSAANYREGVDSPSQKLIGRIVKFKDPSLNNQYFKKLKDISSQFDGVKREFDLYYQDNNPVQLSGPENLFTFIDGVFQEPGVTPLLPQNRAYYIRKNVVPNKIVFVEPPRVFEDIKQSFYGLNIGAYEKLTVDDRYIDNTNFGPFPIKSALTGKTVSVFEDRNLLVFVDGVFQRRGKSYFVRGANITFNEPLRIGQKVSMFYLYGRAYQSVLTAFDFESVPFLNRYEITVRGNLMPSIISTNYEKFEDKTIVSLSTTGTLRNAWFDGNNTILRVESQNKQFKVNEDIIIKSFEQISNQDYTISSDDIISIESFEENDDREDILRKTKPWWLINSSKLPQYINNIDIDDLIKIDGEKSYRKILSIPTSVIKTDYRNIDDLSSSYYGKIGVTNYNETSYGEGLDVIANVENGKVVSLTWNKKDWNSYVTKTIYPRSPGYGYEYSPQLQFVSQSLKDEGGSIIQPPQGGGAKAYVVLHDGDIIDIVLYDQGSGYLTSPKVYVTKGYEIIKKNTAISYVTVAMSGLIETGKTLFVSTGDRLDADQPPAVFISSVLFVTPIEASRKITAIVQLIDDSRVPEQQSPIESLSIINLSIKVDVISANVNQINSIIETPADITSQNNITVTDVFKQLTTSVRSFLKVVYGRAVPSLYSTGAYLDSALSEFDDIVYIPDTSKFLNSGKLLIEGEIVSYESKLSDRFIDVIRGIDGTTAKSHPAGAFVRQYSEDVTIISGGISAEVIVSSEVQVLASNIETVGITSISQVLTNVYVTDVKKEVTGLYKTGVIDFYVENFPLFNEIVQRNLNIVVLNEPINSVLLRNGETILVFNQTRSENTFISYTLGNVGNTFGQIDSWKFADSGVSNVSNMTIEDFSIFYSTFKIEDFTERKDSSISTTNTIWNIGYPSIQEYGTVLTSNISSSITTISVQNTSNFPNSGKLLIGKEVVTYSSKSSTEFLGVVRGINGVNTSHTAGDYLRTAI